MCITHKLSERLHPPFGVQAGRLDLGLFALTNTVPLVHFVFSSPKTWGIFPSSETSRSFRPVCLPMEGPTALRDHSNIWTEGTKIRAARVQRQDDLGRQPVHLSNFQFCRTSSSTLLPYCSLLVSGTIPECLFCDVLFR